MYMYIKIKNLDNMYSIGFILIIRNMRIIIKFYYYYLYIINYFNWNNLIIIK